MRIGGRLRGTPLLTGLPNRLFCDAQYSLGAHHVLYHKGEEEGGVQGDTVELEADER
jgi:hypothetical protein